jgi:hypothetical protein
LRQPDESVSLPVDEKVDRMQLKSISNSVQRIRVSYLTLSAARRAPLIDSFVSRLWSVLLAMGLRLFRIVAER